MHSPLQHTSWGWLLRSATHWATSCLYLISLSLLIWTSRLMCVKCLDQNFVHSEHFIYVNSYLDLLHPNKSFWLFLWIRHVDITSFKWFHLNLMVAKSICWQREQCQVWIPPIHPGYSNNTDNSIAITLGHRPELGDKNSLLKTLYTAITEQEKSGRYQSRSFLPAD